MALLRHSLCSLDPGLSFLSFLRGVNSRVHVKCGSYFLALSSCDSPELQPIIVHSVRIFFFLQHVRQLFNPTSSHYLLVSRAKWTKLRNKPSADKSFFLKPLPKANLSHFVSLFGVQTRRCSSVSLIVLEMEDWGT